MRACDYCGRENPDDAFSCAGCAGELQVEAPVTKLTKAGFWIRAAARIIDTLFVIFLAFITGTVVGLALGLLIGMGLVPPDWLHRLRGLSLLMLLCSVLAKISYHSICEGFYGATLGKICCGICVVSADGQPCHLKGALIRSVAYFFDSMFFGAVVYTAMKKSPQNQRYGDRWGKTAVIMTDEIAPESKRSTACLLLVLALGIAVNVAMVVIGLFLKIWETRG